MRFASTFLSHSKDDRSFVRDVAGELARRGVAVWLDSEQARPGESLGHVLAEGVRSQVTTAVFLSPRSVRSPWVDEELTSAVDHGQRIIPVCLGDPKELISEHARLRRLWMREDGRVDPVCIRTSDPLQCALAIARSVYADMSFETSPQAAVVLDQRGRGPVTAQPPEIPAEIAKRDIPALIFRAGLDRRNPHETLHGVQWEQVRDALRWALEDAFGSIRHRKEVFVTGSSQLSLSYLVGAVLDRSTQAMLTVFGSQGGPIATNTDQERHGHLKGGNPNCTTAHERISPLPAGSAPELALLLMAETYVSNVLDYLASRVPAVPVVWIASGIFKESREFSGYVADVVAFLAKMKRDHGLRRVRLFCGLPFQVMPILAANLLHVVESVVFMEYRRDLQGTSADIGDLYVPLPM